MFQAYGFEKNPYTWGSNSNDIGQGVTTLEFDDGSQTVDVNAKMQVCYTCAYDYYELKK